MLRSLTFGLLLMPLVMLSAAHAHGPTRQKAMETVEIDLPADKVWAAIGDFQNLNWHPVIDKTEGAIVLSAHRCRFMSRVGRAK